VRALLLDQEQLEYSSNLREFEIRSIRSLCHQTDRIGSIRSSSQCPRRRHRRSRFRPLLDHNLITVPSVSDSRVSLPPPLTTLYLSYSSYTISPCVRLLPVAFPFEREIMDILRYQRFNESESFTVSSES